VGAQPALAQDSNGVTASWKLQIAPTLGDPLPLRLTDGLSDYKNTTQLSATIKAPISFATVESTIGIKASHNLNDTTKNSSALFSENEIYFGRGFRRFSPFAFVNGEIGYSNLLDEHTEDTVEYGGGLRIQLLGAVFLECPLKDQDLCFAKGTESRSLTLDTRVGRADSSNPASDYWGPTAALRFMQKFPGSRIILNLDADYQHKEFDAPVGSRRVDDQIRGTAALNFARTIFPKSPGITKLSLGARYTRSWSNYVDGRAKKLQVLPVLTIGASF
jgi:hypothetical protein